MKYRLRKSIQVLGGALTAIFVAATASYCSVFFLDQPENHGFKGEHSTLIVGGLGIIVFGFMTFLSVYILVAYYIESFEVDGSTIRVRSVFQNQQFDISEIQTVTWRIAPANGSILFRLPGRKARLDLNGFSQPDRISIIRFVHSSLPLPRQDGWDMFCHKIALPLRDRVPSTVRVDDSVKLVPLSRKRYDHLLFIVFPPTLLAAFALGWSLKSWHFLVLPVAVLGFWLLLRFSIPKEGGQDVNLLFSPTGRAQLLIVSVLITFQLLLLCLALAGVEKGIACGIVLGVFLVALIPLLRALHKGVRRQQVTELQGAATANEAWQNGELGSNS